MFVKPSTGEPVILTAAVDTIAYHAASLIGIRDRRSICASFAGSKESNNDTAMGLSEKSPGSWSSPVKIAKISDEPH